MTERIVSHVSTKEVQHGTTYSYQRGCRCDECRIAKLKSNRESYWRHHERKRDPLTGPLSNVLTDLTDRRHGTTNGYNNAGCRCDACKAAWSSYMVPRVNKWRRAKRVSA